MAIGNYNPHQFSEKGEEGEKLIKEIAYTSFMKYWCYANPKDINGDKKEICDLMIYFKDKLILICVKNYTFNGNYERYFKRCIVKDIRQLSGAERKIRTSKIAIKHPEREEYETIKIESISKVYKISVHLGSDVQFYSPCNTTSNGVFVHIFDRKALIELIGELDTLPDLLEYLDKRENIFSGKHVLCLPDPNDDMFTKEVSLQFLEHMKNLKTGDMNRILINGREADLVASYLKNERKFASEIWDRGGHLFVELWGDYDKMCERPEVKNKYTADKASYLIDELVRNELLNNHMSIEIAKELMSLDRFQRRCLADNILGFTKKYNLETGNYVARRFSMSNDMGIALLFYTPQMKNLGCVLDEAIKVAFESYVIHHKYKMKKMLLIAMTKDMEQFKFIYSDSIVPYSSEIETDIMSAARSLGWFQQEVEIHRNYSEYPD